MHHMLPPDNRLPIVIGEQNVESSILDQRLTVGQSPPSARHVHRFKNIERRAWRAAHTVVAVTHEDATLIQIAEPSARVRIVPNGWNHIGVRCDHTRVSVDKSPVPKLLFLSNFAYLPNQDGLLWLMQTIMPQVWSQLPKARLVVAGTGSREFAQHLVLDSRVDVRGWCESVESEIDRADIVLCPLRLGGGIKVKLIEAIRRRRPVVSTLIGAQGVTGATRQAIHIRDDPAEFARSIFTLATSPIERQRVQQQFAISSSNSPCWEDSAGELLRIWQDASTSASLI